MSLWENILNGLEEGLLTLSEKTTEVSKLVRMKWERRTMQNELYLEFKKLGEAVYTTQVEKKESSLQERIKNNLKVLKDLEKRLETKEKEIEELSARMDRTQVRGLKKDLEMGDGTIEQIVVGERSSLSGKKLSEIQFPKAVLVGTVVRDEKVIIPDGQTVLQKGDKVTLLGKKKNVQDVIKQLAK